MYSSICPRAYISPHTGSSIHHVHNTWTDMDYVCIQMNKHEICMHAYGQAQIISGCTTCSWRQNICRIRAGRHLKENSFYKYSRSIWIRTQMHDCLSRRLSKIGLYYLWSILPARCRYWSEPLPGQGVFSIWFPLVYNFFLFIIYFVILGEMYDTFIHFHIHFMKLWTRISFIS